MKKTADFLLLNWLDFLVVLLCFFLFELPHLPNSFVLVNGYIAMLVLWFVVVKPRINQKPFVLHRSYYVLFYLTVLCGILLSRLLTRQFGSYSAPFFIPITLIALLYNKELAVAASIYFALFFSTVSGFNSLGFTLMLTTCLIAAIAGSKIEKRMQVAKSAFFVGVTSIVFYILHIKMQGLKADYLQMLIAFFMPFVSSVVCIGLLPFIEYASMIYSNIDLIELGNLNNPLLKTLSLRAPGTYYHSSMVANLAEAAAQRIGANAILARTAAYFHDVGKAKRPYFYTENIFQENPHDELSPKLSHLVIQDHVKAGLEMARRNRLPLLVQDVIPQHHGTRVQKYFYHKSKELGEELNENEFRYPGPKPQFKEAGIIMLADAVEAAARSLKNPSAGRVQVMVEEIISGIYNERELDESGLTLKDLEAIAEEFTKVLLNIFKNRIEYPREDIKKVISLAQNSFDQQNKKTDKQESDQQNDGQGHRK
ncbi:MAG TPA: HDIG domain-containing protein [Pseudothermotoga sp.]|nr:HDIG domain-containing protein [Pseudothermotoga sp.]